MRQSARPLTRRSMRTRGTPICLQRKPLFNVTSSKCLMSVVVELCPGRQNNEE